MKERLEAFNRKLHKYKYESLCAGNDQRRVFYNFYYLLSDWHVPQISRIENVPLFVRYETRTEWTEHYRVSVFSLTVLFYFYKPGLKHIALLFCRGDVKKRIKRTVICYIRFRKKKKNKQTNKQTHALQGLGIITINAHNRNILHDRRK